jgi:arylformamidase
MRRMLIVLVAVISAAGLAACKPTTPGGGGSTTTSTSTTSTTVPNCKSPAPKTTVRYATIPGFTANSTSLDVYTPTRPCNAPVVMWVHGGGYHTGDKANQIADKVTLFRGRGEILVSVNYRLTIAGDPDSAHYPDHYVDVSHAVKWVHDNIATYGGDPSRIALLGHSAGADIVSNVVTNPVYLDAFGLPLSVITCAGPFDTEGFDKVASNGGDEEALQWLDALGNAPNYQVTTSAKTYVAAGKGIPPMISVVRGTATRRAIEQAFIDQLNAAGIPATKIDAQTLTHGEVNSQIGAPGDTVMTPPLTAFLDTCFDK